MDESDRRPSIQPLCVYHAENMPSPRAKTCSVGRCAFLGGGMVFPGPPLEENSRAYALGYYGLFKRTDSHK